MQAVNLCFFFKKCGRDRVYKLVEIKNLFKIEWNKKKIPSFLLTFGAYEIERSN